MKIVLNSKFFQELSVKELGEKMKELGYDGIDICVRPGHPVNPENAEKTLPQAQRIWQDQGLICPLASTPVNFNDPAVPEAERVYAACAAAGIPHIKLGYWMFSEGEDYWQVLDRARADLEAFARLSERYGVKSCYHTHSGPCIGSNCAGLMHLVKGFDPNLVGVYPDFGHMTFDGEDMAMGLSMIRDYLAVVGVKDGFHVRQPEGSEPPYVPMFTSLGVGSVNWRRALTLLSEMGFTGALSVHTEYNFGESIIRQVGYADERPENLDEIAREDATYLRRLLQEM
jgi:sugar phosphate isomerase/epimerase